MLWSHSVLLHDSNRTIATLSGAFYLTNLIYDYVCGNLAHLWSLSVEEHFYLVWPLTALFLLFRITDKKKYSFFVLLIVALSAFRVLAFLYQDKWVYGIFRINPYEFTLCRIDGIVMGALLYFLVHNKVISGDFLGAKRYATAYLILIFLFFLAFGLRVGLYSPYWMEGGFIITNLACVFTVFVSVANPDHIFLSNRIISWVGKRSYGIYAYHFPIFLATEHYAVPGNAVNLIVLSTARFVLTIVLAVLSYNYIERPILRLKSNFKPRTVVEA
jgi:peptidoglycan/LPS O-acetylase OafA/YrhL